MGEASVEVIKNLTNGVFVKSPTSEINEKVLDVKTEIESSRDKRRREILTSIAENGLLPARKVAEKINPSTSEDSLDSERTTLVSGTLVFSENQQLQIEKTMIPNFIYEKPADQIRLKMSYAEKNITIYLPIGENDVDNGIIDVALYNGDSSVFPVVCERGYERKYETAEQSQAVLEDRVQNSILIVTEMDNIKSFSNKSNEVYLPELAPDKMTVLVPSGIFEEAKNIFGSRSIPVISVPFIEKQIYKGRRQNEIPTSVRVKLPDFEKKVREMTAESKSPLFIHGVRLPTEEDVRMAEVIKPHWKNSDSNYSIPPY